MLACLLVPRSSRAFLPQFSSTFKPLVFAFQHMPQLACAGLGVIKWDKPARLELPGPPLQADGKERPRAVCCMYMVSCM